MVEIVRVMKVANKTVILNIDYQQIIKQALISLKMEALTNTLLRPYRATYSLNDLGPKKTNKYNRFDQFITNDREQNIQYSYYQHNNNSDICAIYCHCNSGSRIQGAQYLQHIIEKGWNACLFDFSGSGLSQGNYISLGHYEALDLETIIQKVRVLGNKKIVLWGRSMGAATIIFYLNHTKYREDIVACILDSPYSSLWELIKQIGIDRSILPGFILEQILGFLRSKIKQQHCFDIKQLEPIKCVSNIDIPLLFITSVMDEFVKSDDVVQLYKQAASKNKQLQYIDKSHNSSRDNETVGLAINFLSKCLLDRTKKRKQMKFLSKQCLTINGGNMAELIIKAQKEKSRIKKMKSEANIQKSFKQNKSKFNNVHMKTEFISHNSTVLSNKPDIINQKLNCTFMEKKKTINFSLAHIENKKKSNPFVTTSLYNA